MCLPLPVMDCCSSDSVSSRQCLASVRSFSAWKRSIDEPGRRQRAKGGVGGPQNHSFQHRSASSGGRDPCTRCRGIAGYLTRWLAMVTSARDVLGLERSHRRATPLYHLVFPMGANVP